MGKGWKLQTGTDFTAAAAANGDNDNQSFLEYWVFSNLPKAFPLAQFPARLWRRQEKD